MARWKNMTYKVLILTEKKPFGNLHKYIQSCPHIMFPSLVPVKSHTT